MATPCRRPPWLPVPHRPGVADVRAVRAQTQPQLNRNSTASPTASLRPREVCHGVTILTSQRPSTVHVLPVGENGGGRRRGSGRKRLGMHSTHAMHARISPFLMPARATTVFRCVSWWACAYVGLRLVGMIAVYVFGGIGVWWCGVYLENQEGYFLMKSSSFGIFTHFLFLAIFMLLPLSCFRRKIESFTCVRLAVKSSLP